jgi:hypothetical protein
MERRPRERGRGGGRAEWLTRRQVARIAGLDERRTIQMDGQELHPVRRPDGSWTRRLLCVDDRQLFSGVLATTTDG